MIEAVHRMTRGSHNSEPLDNKEENDGRRVKCQILF